MTIQELINAKNACINNNPTASMFFVLTDNSIRKINFEAGVPQNICAKYIENINNNIHDGCRMENISSSIQLKDTIYELDIPLPDELIIIQKLLVNNGNGLSVFNFVNDGIKKLKFLIVIIGHGLHKLLLIQKIEQISILRRDSQFFLRKSADNNQLISQVDDDLIKFSYKFDMICCENTFFSTNPRFVDRNFKMCDIYINAAKAQISKIDSYGLLYDKSILESAISKDQYLSLARRMSSAFDNSPVIKKGIPVQNIVNYVKGHPVLSKKISVKNNKLQIKSENNAVYLVKLLNDDYLTSTLTSNNYDIELRKFPL